MVAFLSLNSYKPVEYWNPQGECIKKGKEGRDWIREDRAGDGGEGEAACTSLSPGQVNSIENTPPANSGL